MTYPREAIEADFRPPHLETVIPPPAELADPPRVNFRAQVFLDEKGRAFGEKDQFNTPDRGPISRMLISQDMPATLNDLRWLNGLPPLPPLDPAGDEWDSPRFTKSPSRVQATPTAPNRMPVLAGFLAGLFVGAGSAFLILA